MSSKRQKILVKASIITLVLNVLLAGGKIITGLVLSSPAVLSDGLHSIADGAATVAVLFGVKLSGAESDSTHPYGHERIEFVVALLLAFMLLVTGGYIAYSAVMGLVEAKRPGGFFIIPAAVTAVSIAVKESMYQITSRSAKKYNSAALSAVAVDHRIDSMSSLAVLAGLVFARFGMWWAEYAAACVIAVITIVEAVKLLFESSHQLIDSSAGEDTEDKIKERTMRIRYILGIDSLKTRMFGSRLYVDIDIVVDKDLSFAEAHRVSHEVHDMIEAEFDAKHVQVHTSPCK